jgi:hypothetical protein
METDYYMCYKNTKNKSTEIHSVNNKGKINILIAFIFFSHGLIDSGALRWTEAYFMGIE